VDASPSRDERLEQALSALSALLAEGGVGPAGLQPHIQARGRRPAARGRFSATDRLSWWFRPAAAGVDPWESFFEGTGHTPLAPRSLSTLANSDDVFVQPNPQPARGQTWSRPPGRRASLRMVLWEAEDELFDADAEAVVAGLYDYLHAIGNRDVDRALECVAEDYHTLEEDREVDKQGLRQQMSALLDSLRDWEFDISLVEIPQPIPHPQAILIYAEIQLEATRAGGTERRSEIFPRIVVFQQQPDKRWLISALSPCPDRH
jgi:ketosteroid isomerase-like protein